MKKREEIYAKNIKEKYILNKNSILRVFFPSTLKFSLAIALFIFLSVIVNAGDVVVESGKLDVSSNLYVDAGGNVGIGTGVRTPSQKLEVVGNIAVSGTVDGRDVSVDGSKLDGIAVGAADTTSDSWSGTTDVTMTSGKVGIGTTSPNRKLHTKDTTADNVLVIDSGDGSTQRYSALDFYDNSAGKWGIGKNPDGNFYIDQFGGGSAITILSSNRNVGIGTTTPPSEKLEVAGNIRGTGFCIGSSPCITSWPSSGSALPSGSSGQTLRHDGANWVANSILKNNGIDTVTIERGDEATLKITNTGAGGKSWALISSGSGGLGGAGKFSIYDTSGGGNSRLLIDNNGNVGIGTTTPNAILHVFGGSGPSVTGEGISIDGTDVAGNPRIELRKSGTTPYLDFSNDGATDFDMRLRLTGDDSLAIEGGNVGIGTTPTSWAKLDVAGDMSVRGASNWGGTDVAVITSEAVGKPLVMKARGGVAPDLVVAPSGNVGIGMTNPQARLQVGGELLADWAHIAWHRINWGDVENTCGGSHTSGGGRTHLFGTDIHGGCGDAGWIRYYSDGGNNENLRLEMRIQNDDNDDIYIRGTGGTTTGTGDLAELYYSSEELQLGDVVVMDPERPTSIKKSTKAYQHGIVGVTSAKPFALLMATNDKVLDDSDYKPTSLAGKIIVKVSLENGVIKTGDALTSSSTPGYAMRATRAGNIIGYAFEDFDGSVQSSNGVEKMYQDVSLGCANCEQSLRVFGNTAKSSPGAYQKGVMTVLVNPGFWSPPETMPYAEVALFEMLKTQQQQIDVLQNQVKELTTKLSTKQWLT